MPKQFVSRWTVALVETFSRSCCHQHHCRPATSTRNAEVSHKTAPVEFPRPKNERQRSSVNKFLCDMKTTVFRNLPRSQLVENNAIERCGVSHATFLHMGHVHGKYDFGPLCFRGTLEFWKTHETELERRMTISHHLFLRDSQFHPPRDLFVH